MNAIENNLLNTATVVTRGLVKGEFLYEKAGIDPAKQWLYLNKDNDIDIPLLPNDHIIIHGGERIFAGDANVDIGENPNVRIPVCFQLNGQRFETSKAKLTGHDLRKRDEELDASKLFVDLSGQVDAFIQDDWVLVVQEKDCYITIPVGDDEIIDLEECARHGRKPPKDQQLYKIKIDGEKRTVNKPVLTGAAILKLAGGKTFGEYSLNQKFHGGRRKPIEAEQEVDLLHPGIERFETAPRQAQQGACTR